MPVYPITYTQMWGRVSPAFPQGRLVRRPILRLGLKNAAFRTTCFAIVDSGADQCVFPRSFMRPLGLDPLDANVDLTSGVASSKVPTLFANVTIDIGVTSFEAYSGFTAGLDHLAIGLLGQSGFFDKCKITFDYQNKLFTIELP